MYDMSVIQISFGEIFCKFNCFGRLKNLSTIQICEVILENIPILHALLNRDVFQLKRQKPMSAIKVMKVKKYV